MTKVDQIEILFVDSSSLDDRGRRVVICEGTVQNILWPEDEIGEIERRLLGITPEAKADIEEFFLEGGR